MSSAKAPNSEQTLFGKMVERIKQAPAEIGKELKHKMEHGAHEAAAAIFQGSPFVMYPKDAPEQQQEKQQEAPQQSRGIEM